MVDRPGPTLRRLFAGTFLSSQQQELLGGLKDDCSRLSSDWHRKLRFVNGVKLHLTWLFLGSVKEELMDEIKGRLVELSSRHTATKIVYDQVEFWPSPRYPRQLVLTASSVTDQARALAGEVRAALGDLATKPDTRPFKPHITLLRFERTSERPASGPLMIPEWWPVDRCLPLAQRIDSLSLIESHLGAAGDRYETLAEFRLAK